MPPTQPPFIGSSSSHTINTFNQTNPSMAAPSSTIATAATAHHPFLPPPHQPSSHSSSSSHNANAHYHHRSDAAQYVDDDDDDDFKVPHPSIPLIVPINVGGEVMQVAAATLAKAPSSILYHLARRLYMARARATRRRATGNEEEEDLHHYGPSSATNRVSSSGTHTTTLVDGGVCTDDQGRLFLDHDAACVRYLINRLRGYRLEGGAGGALVGAGMGESAAVTPAVVYRGGPLSWRAGGKGGDGGGPLQYGPTVISTSATSSSLLTSGGAQQPQQRVLGPDAGALVGPSAAEGGLSLGGGGALRALLLEDLRQDAALLGLSFLLQDDGDDEGRGANGDGSAGYSSSSSSGGEEDEEEEAAAAGSLLGAPRLSEYRHRDGRLRRRGRRGRRIEGSLTPVGNAPSSSAAATVNHACTFTNASTRGMGRTLSSRLVVGAVGAPMQTAALVASRGRREMSFLVEECEAVGIGVIADDANAGDFTADFGEVTGCACLYSSGKVSYKYPQYVLETAGMRFGAGCVVTVVVDFDSKRIHWEVGGEGALAYAGPPLSSASASSAQQPAPPTGAQPIPPDSPAAPGVIMGRVVAVASMAYCLPATLRFAVALQGESTVTITKRPAHVLPSPSVPAHHHGAAGASAAIGGGSGVDIASGPQGPAEGNREALVPSRGSELLLGGGGGRSGDDQPPWLLHPALANAVRR